MSRSLWSGFTLVEIMIVVAIIGVVSAVAVPNFIKARSSARVKVCIANLTEINGIKSQWAIENKKGNEDIPSADELASYFRTGSMPTCPANGAYTIRRVASRPRCTLAYEGHTMSNLNMDDDAMAD
jgi:prepilin-type N-terminal cleavage/methylation domain-containing protein